MYRSAFFVVIALGAAALLVAFAQGSGDASGGSTLTVAGTVRELAADGDRVAALVDSSGPGCPSSRAVVWRPATRSVVRIGSRGCRPDTSTGSGLYGLALAGTRVAYVDFAGGNIRELRLRTATLTGRRLATVASSAHDVDGGAGTSIGRTLGDRGLLVFAVRHDAPGGVDEEAVWRFARGAARCPQNYLGGARSCALVRSAAGPLGLLAADGGRIVLREAEGRLEVVEADGTVVSTLPFRPDEVRAAKLEGRTLVVLRRDAERRDWIDVYDAASGKLETGYRLETRAATSGDAYCGEPEGCRLPALRLEDVHARVAAYVAGRDVHLLRLRDGKDVAVRVPGSGTVHAQLEAAGLFTGSGARIAFEPFSSLMRRLGS